jgi:hypothetical protein
MPKKGYRDSAGAVNRSKKTGGSDPAGPKGNTFRDAAGAANTRVSRGGGMKKQNPRDGRNGEGGN